MLRDRETLPLGFDITKQNSWEEVMDLAKQAENKYFAEAGPARRVLRGVGDYAIGAQWWAGLLPNDSYMSILSGGLKLLLAVSFYDTKASLMLTSYYDRQQPEELSKEKEFSSR